MKTDRFGWCGKGPKLGDLPFPNDKQLHNILLVHPGGFCNVAVDHPVGFDAVRFRTVRSHTVGYCKLRSFMILALHQLPIAYALRFR